MQFETVLKETVWLLLTEQRVSYQRLRAQFELDETRLEALRYELINVKHWAVDEGGVVLAASMHGGEDSSISIAEFDCNVDYFGASRRPSIL